MDIQEYIINMKDIYNSLLEFVDSDEEEELFNALAHKINDHNILESSDDLHELLLLINSISSNHHRRPGFISKIDRIIIFLSTSIKQSFTNIQIFSFFKFNKRILLTLIKNKIIIVDEFISTLLLDQSDENRQDYRFYFFNEIKEYIPNSDKKSIEAYLLQKDPHIFENFDEKCQIGENDSYICELIRNDSVEEFISFVNRYNYPLNSIVERSIFETNPFLLNKKNITDLIGYAAFFGSFQIFQYLMFNGVDLYPNLWLYTIHGRNPELIHLLEQYKVNPELVGQIQDEQKIIEKYYFEQKFGYIFNRAAICHHNEIVEYIENNFLIEEVGDSIETTDNKVSQTNISKVFNFFKNLFKKEEIADSNMKQNLVYKMIPADHTFLKSHNYQYIKIDPNNAHTIELLLKYDYLKIVKILYDKEIINLNDKIIFNIIYINRNEKILLFNFLIRLFKLLHKEVTLKW